jgi:integrase
MVYARVTFTDALGNRCQRWRRAKNKTEAKRIAKEMLREMEQHGESALNYDRLTFRELADYFEKTYIIPAQYVDGRKVAGFRSVDQVCSSLRAVRHFFGDKRIRSITRGDIERFKSERLATPTTRKRARSIASVNRELSLLSRMFKIALAEGWIIRNPLLGGKSLISTADENIRQRILTREEEQRLLAARTGKRAHLKPLVICAIDTGMRRGEILKLKWSDIDFQHYIINILAFNTKTMRERQVAITERLLSELKSLYERSSKTADALVFGCTNIRTAFQSARRVAGLEDVRWHDLRHVHATRLVAANIPLPEISRVLGHTSPTMTYRYVTATVDTARRAAAALDEFNRVTDG